MVKGVSRQVIVVRNPDKELFEQAIFILTDAAAQKGVTDQMLLKQANQVIRAAGKKQRKNTLWCLLWTCIGAAVTAAAWLITAFL